MHRASPTLGGTILALIGAAMCIAGCQTAPLVRTQLAPGDVLTHFNTYNYFTPLGTDKHGYTTITTNLIKTAVDREMRARGYVLGPNPEMLVNANITTQDTIQSTPGFDAGSGFGGWRRGFGYGGWGGWGGDEIVTVTEGTLTIDVVNKARMELAWTGSATRILNSKALDQPQPAIDQGVSAIFRTFPTTTGRML